MSKTIRNNLNRPLYLNLPLRTPKSPRSLKIRARSIVQIEESDLKCSALEFHIRRGNISIIEQPAKPVGVALSAAAPVEAVKERPSDVPKPSAKGKPGEEDKPVKKVKPKPEEEPSEEK